MSMNEGTGSGLDLVGIGKLAEAIPDDVYTKTSESLLRTFEALLAPLTETTGGVGRYLRQKFDNMVEVEKALATYSLEKACLRAARKASRIGATVKPPLHLKSFIKALDEASKETNPTLHEYWVSILASQMIEGQCHPHLVEILPHFSIQEAEILTLLRSRNEVGETGGGYLYCDMGKLDYWITGSDDDNPKNWTPSCILLCQLGLADIISSKGGDQSPTILYRTTWGKQLLEAVI